jgi:beta-glucosidase-like glycosyl hydrolase
VKNVTGFPTGINTASTFNRRLMRQRGVALAEEFRGKGAQSVQLNAKSERRIDFHRDYAVFSWDLRWILCVTSFNYMLVLMNPDCR